MDVIVAGVPSEDESVGGVASLDEGGHLLLTEAVRAALGVQPGSPVAYLVVDGRLIVMPYDQEVMQSLDEASAILAATGLTTADLLDRLPAIREAVMRRTYGDAFVDELARDHARLRAERTA